jgi:hypothetical protein
LGVEVDDGVSFVGRVVVEVEVWVLMLIVVMAFSGVEFGGADILISVLGK